MVLIKAIAVEQQGWKPFWNLLKSDFHQNVEVIFAGQPEETELGKQVWGNWAVAEGVTE